MNDRYEILQVSPSATDEEIEQAYLALKKKYGEERWQDGEAGKNAVRMLEKLDAAYEEIKRERSEKAAGGERSALGDVRERIEKEDLDGAQSRLDAFNERDAEWHYLQAVVFYKKNWVNESKKQLEIAMQLDPSNEKYKTAHEKIKTRAEYRSQPASTPVQEPMADEQMGGNTCTTLWNTCACLSWLWCCCSGCR